MTSHRHTKRIAGWITDVLSGEKEPITWDVALSLAPVPPNGELGGVIITYIAVKSHAHLGAVHSNVTISPPDLAEPLMRATIVRQLAEVRRVRATELAEQNGKVTTPMA